MLGADHRGLHKKEIGTGFGDGFAEFEGGHGRGAHGGNATALLDFSDPQADQVFAHRLAVELLHQRHELLFADRGDAVEHRVGVVVAALHPLKVEHPEGAQLGELTAHPHIHHAIHGAGNDRDLPGDSAQGPAAVRDRRVHGATPWHQGNLIDAIGTTHRAGATELNVHLKLPYSGQPINRSAALSRPGCGWTSCG